MTIVSTRTPARHALVSGAHTIERLGADALPVATWVIEQPVTRRRAPGLMVRTVRATARVLGGAG